MNIQNAIYTESDSISATVNGTSMVFPATPGNRHYDEMVRQGIAPAPYVAPAPTVDNVKAEAEQRILLIAPLWRQINTLRGNPNDPIFTQIDAIRAASDALEIMDPIPADYATNDAYWGA